MAICYTPGQLRDALGLTKEKFRYWKKELPALASGRGQRARFGLNDLLATAIVKRMSDVASVPVSRLAPSSYDLFAICREGAWPQLERMSVMLMLETDEIKLVPSDAALSMSCVAIVLPLRPVIDALRKQLHQAEMPDTQGSLAFPPFALSKGVGL